jgi:hypothetical protein
MRDDLPTDPVERLKMAAAGRRDYAKDVTWAKDKDYLENEARMLSWAIDIIQNDAALEMAVHSGFIWPPEKRLALLLEASERLRKAAEDA